ncbi:glycoside hydrolase family 16 protein [Mycena crocata]|nr:glycoside hydrolase family 16 protein [Mycena crocata]
MLVSAAFLFVSSLSAGAFAKPATPRSFRSRSPISVRQAGNKTWTQVDKYQGQNFLEQWKFETYQGDEPTHGLVNYQNQADAVSKKLATVDGNMLTLSVDDFTPLTSGQKRDSVRISSQKTYNSGLFIADFAMMPASCGAWPAWWSVGPGWPNGGEIDVLEGVAITGNNKMTLHTSAGCVIDPAEQTGKVDNANCISGPDAGGDNTGCGVIDNDPTSYGKGFNDAKGGVFAHEWLPTGIRIWHFSSTNIPPDIKSGTPNPDTWGIPTAHFPAGPNCDMTSHFKDHVLTIDTTLCGDWAGAAFGSSGCPQASCADAVADPNNFHDAKWKINSITVYN